MKSTSFDGLVNKSKKKKTLAIPSKINKYNSFFAQLNVFNLH